MGNERNVTGTVAFVGGDGSGGLRIQALDRDLPSLERRAGANANGRILGETVADAEGRFQIIYRLEQFHDGEAVSSFRRPIERNADVSFRAFDKGGQELSISSVEAFNRKYGTGQIIFNVPTLLEVSIFVDASASHGHLSDSEYELLVALLAPVVEDVPLLDLTDDDVAFLINELGLEQQRDAPQRLEWLRRSALLALDANLPVEAFYGWGRRDVPASFSELAAVPPRDLASVLKKLLGLRPEKLREALLAAVDQNIIPVGFRDRVDEIVRSLQRSDQVQRRVVVRLQDAETEAPLAGYSVTTFEGDGADDSRGLDVTDEEGRFAFVFHVPKEVPAGTAPRSFRLEVSAPGGERLAEDARVRVDLSKPETEVFAAVVKVPKPEVTEQQEQLKSVLRDVPRELRSFLVDTHGVQTLADIRRKGGLSRLAGLPRTAEPGIVRKLESLADLDRVSADVGVSTMLVDRNFGSVLAIAETPHSEFVAAVSSGERAVSQAEAARLHLMADAQTRVLDNVLLREAADNANGFEVRAAEGAEPAAASERPCGCSDCEAAVSPTAYLAALLDYTLKHVRNGKAKVDLQFLVDAWHQPFIDLPTDCEAVERQVRQVRICVEVLRSYLGPRPLIDPAKEAALSEAEAAYGFAAYTALLGRVGTSYEEIRRTRGETTETRHALADRLGIDLSAPRSADELDQLFLDSGARPPEEHLLTEQGIEQLFGLADTTRDPLSEGAKLGDAGAQITRWNLNGAVWGQNTDADGLVHVALVNPAPAVFRLELYRDRVRTQLVASGEIASATGRVKLVPEPDSALSGVFEIAYTADASDISIEAFPALLSWKLKHLRTLWTRQDHPLDAYSAGASPALPIIDPDLLGPDDFRNPAPKSNAAGPDRAYDLWLQRRKFVDAQLAGLKASREAKGLTEILKQALGQPLPDLDALLLTLTGGGSGEEIASAKKTIASLDLSLESFTRLMSIRAKDQLARSDARNEGVSEQEWQEIYSILTQALKAKRFGAWRAAEQTAGTTLGLDEFWFSVTEPKDGDWPPEPTPNRPLIDPGFVKLTDLPDWLMGKDAVGLWTARKARLEQIPKQLKLERETKGFDAALRLALGHPAPGNPLQHDFNALAAGLASADDKVRAVATTRISDDLHLTPESFKRVMEIDAANDQASPASKPTAAEWSELFAILTPARKTKHEYPAWILEETKVGLVYWKAFKARLPRWRASLELRQAWLQALRVRSQPPVIEPTLMGADDLRHVVPGDPAFDLWKARNDRLVVLHDDLKNAREAVDPDTLAGLDTIIEDALGFASADLAELDREGRAGHSIEKRLEQLNLARSAFAYLLRIRDLAEAKQPVTASEWETVYATLARAKSQREYAAMRREEQDTGTSLSPELFKISQGLPLPVSVELSTPRWLSTWQARRDWQDALQSRIDQQDTVAEGMRSAVSAVEEVTLPALRDALIAASDAEGTEPNARAEWITSRLLIDARAGGCQLTTRVAQALETIQALIFGLRTAQFQQLPASPLSLVSDHADEEWKWIGSYATWRSAMFVSLYPENILQPSLLKNKSPAFEALIKNTRGLRISPAAACKEAETYGTYFRDICSLEIQATCQASTVVYSGEGCDRRPSNSMSMFYMFARADSGRIYWSAYDPDSASAFRQTFWREVVAFGDAKVVRIIGAMPYRKRVVAPEKLAGTGLARRLEQSAYVHLFCITENAGTRALKLARLNLDEFGVWDKTVGDLMKPPPPFSISDLEVLPVQTQSEFTRPGLVLHRPKDHRLYYRQLNIDGTEWEQSTVDWSSFCFVTSFKVIGKIRAVLKVNSSNLWIVNSVMPGTNNLELGWMELSPEGMARGNSSISVRFDDHTFEFLGAVPGPESDPNFPTVIEQASTVYVFLRTSSGSQYRRFTSIGAEQDASPMHDALADLIGISPNSGSGASGREVLAYQRAKNERAYYLYQYIESGDELQSSATLRAAPRVNAPLSLPLHLGEAELQKRRLEIVDAFALNEDASGSVSAYLREAYYFVPLHLALALQSGGQYLASLDCFRTFYDYDSERGTASERSIYYGLKLDAELPDIPRYQQVDGWLLDPLNPHAIAETRRYSYTRFTVMSLVRCLLDFADSEFAQETAEALGRARTLYVTALTMLNLPELRQALGTCDELIAELKIEPGQDIPPEVPAAVGEILEALTRKAPSTKDFHKATQDVKAQLQAKSEWTVKLAAARAIVQVVGRDTPPASGVGSMVAARTSFARERHSLLLADSGTDQAVQAVGMAVARVALAATGQAQVSPPSAGKALQAPGPQSSSPAFVPSFQFCVPPSPILKALRLHAELNLYKLRTCRNIAGMKRELDPYAAPTDTTTGLPSIGAGGQLVLPGVARIEPSLYRYPVLIERAKQLVQLAAQSESSMLSALERRDAEAQSSLQARQQLGLAHAGVRLQDLRVGEANDGVALAGLQQERAQIQVDTYTDWLEMGANEYESQMIEAYGAAAAAQKGATEASYKIQVKQSAISSAQLAAQVAAASGQFGAITGPAAGYANFIIDEQFFRDLNDDTKTAIDKAAAAQIASIHAALERRKDEWQLQKRLAEQDSRIGEQQTVIAKDHLQIATQERTIAGIQADNAKDSLEFLTNKFTNFELFDWMSGVLEGVYRFFLQQATAMATLAANQLAFQRQEVPPAFVQADYWEIPSDGAVLGGTDGQGPDRRGLTGSARLLQDIYRLDQYAFQTDKRKLQLSKTISLARLAPVEFERLRETGVMLFATPMELFDRGFPGHYLRLIRRVRVSIIALIPPIGGVHATLSTTGTSRVVIGGDVFQTVPIRRGPEFIALSAPSGSSGVVELEAQPDMLLPFEGSGVDMMWEFRMPKAANAFDYRTLADVLITLDYTALRSFDYEQQVIQSFKPTVSADRPFSLRRQFADQWYDLHNPDQTSEPMTVSFTTTKQDFPLNNTALKIQHVLLRFVGGDAAVGEAVSQLRYTALGEAGAVGGSAAPIDGIISTRRGNAGSWTSMIGKSPIGKWELALPNTEEMRRRFQDEDSSGTIEDILLVVTYSSRTPEWPA